MNTQTCRANRIIVPALIMGGIAFVTPAFGQVTNEDVKLLPSDGEAGDQFGWSIAISDGVVAVGAQSDDDNGSNSGSVYLFDAATGVQIDKLLPDQRRRPRIDGLPPANLLRPQERIQRAVAITRTRSRARTGRRTGARPEFGRCSNASRTGRQCPTPKGDV